jgi:hypothetical protein
MDIRIIDGFVWLIVTHKAREIWASDLFELFIIYDDGSEASVYGYGIDTALEIVEKHGLEIGIEVGYVSLNDPRRFNSFEISTTAFNEENFVIATDLTESQIVEVITPIVMREREFDEEYDNARLVDELEYVYQENIIIEVQPKKIVI